MSMKQFKDELNTVPPIGRVAVVGVGAVGATTAFAMASNHVCQEIVLVDDYSYRKAEGELLDLQHSLPFTGPCKITLSTVSELENCDFIVITSGAAQRDGETRLDLMKRNVEIYHGFFPTLSKNNPNAMFCIVTNPVDIMTRVAMDLSGLPTERVFGSGTVLDTARFRQNLSEFLKVSNVNIHAYVIGEHGDSEVLVWSRCMIGPYSVFEYAEMTGIKLDQSAMKKIDEDVRKAAYQIIERKGSTHFAIGVGTAKLVEIISHNRHQIYTVSRKVNSPEIPEDVCISLPTELCRAGALTQLNLPLNDEEKAAFKRSGEILASAYDSLSKQS